ncbi:MAG: adenylate/guanylate cyclase domain-containing protein [Microthrixaceae bacterium]
MEPSATVAVLFCDVVGSTTRQVRLGDVRADGHRRRLFALLEGAVSTSDGMVVKTLGDGLMAVFQRSTVSALSVRRLCTSIARDFDPEDPLELRVGVSVGEVLEEDGDWFGTPVVEAARLCDAAGDGRTLAHALVASLVGSRATGFSFVERGERNPPGAVGTHTGGHRDGQRGPRDRPVRPRERLLTGAARDLRCSAGSPPVGPPVASPCAGRSGCRSGGSGGDGAVGNLHRWRR